MHKLSEKGRAVLSCLLLCGAYFFCQVLIGLLFSFVYLAVGFPFNQLEQRLSEETFGIQIIAALLFFLFLWLHGKRKGKEMADSPPTSLKPAAVIAALGLAFSFSLFWTFLTRNIRLDNQTMITESFDYYAQISPWLAYVLMTLSLYVLAPWAEELLCRKWMIRYLREAFSAWTALLISSLLFALFHLPAGGPLLALGAFFMGIIFGFIYLYTTSFKLTVLAHSLANLADLFLLFIPSEWSRALLWLSVILFLSSFLYFWKQRGEMTRLN